MHRWVDKQSAGRRSVEKSAAHPPPGNGAARGAARGAATRRTGFHCEKHALLEESRGAELRNAWLLDARGAVWEVPSHVVRVAPNEVSQTARKEDRAHLRKDVRGGESNREQDAREM